jgi:hypothetical protein
MKKKEGLKCPTLLHHRMSLQPKSIHHPAGNDFGVSADPSLRPLFKGNLRQQGDKLMRMIGAVVGKPSAATAAASGALRHEAG